MSQLLLCRWKPLSAYQQGQIVAFHEQGFSMCEMAKKLGRSLCVAQNFLKNREKYGKLKSTGRPKVPSAVKLGYSHERHRTP